MLDWQPETDNICSATTHAEPGQEQPELAPFVATGPTCRTSLVETSSCFLISLLSPPVHANRVWEQLSKGKAEHQMISPGQEASSRWWELSATANTGQISSGGAKLLAVSAWHLTSKCFKTKGIHGFKQGELFAPLFYFILFYFILFYFIPVKRYNGWRVVLLKQVH